MEFSTTMPTVCGLEKERLALKSPRSLWILDKNRCFFHCPKEKLCCYRMFLSRARPATACFLKCGTTTNHEADPTVNSDTFSGGVRAGSATGIPARPANH